MYQFTSLTRSSSTRLGEPAPLRRQLVRGAAALAGGVLSLSVAGPAALPGFRRAAAQDSTPAALSGGFFEDEADVLNFALRLERLDSTLYRQGLETFAEQDFADAGYDPDVRNNLAQIVENEETQVEFLSDTISDLGDEPVGPEEYTFPYTTLPEFLALSQQVEEVGLDAYTGAAQFLIGNDDLLTAALTIHAVEARHLAYFRLLNGVAPAPEAFELPLTPTEVLAAVQPFLVNGIGTPEPS
jgi:hypothetical protein